MLRTGNTLATGLYDFRSHDWAYISHLVFAINVNGNESINLVAVPSVSLALLSIQRRVYEHKQKDFLKSILLYFQPGNFSAQAFISKQNPKMPVSLSFHFITFLIKLNITSAWSSNQHSASANFTRPEITQVYITISKGEGVASYQRVRRKYFGTVEPL